MKGTVATALAVVCAAGVLSGTAAQAAGSDSVLGGNSATICSEQASAVVSGGRATVNGLDACNEAIKYDALSTAELAASYVNRGVMHLSIGNYAAAIADDDAALRLQATLADAYVNRGAAHAAQKRFADAVGDFDHALALAPRHPERIYYNRGLAQEDLGDLKAAYLDYLKASQLAPSWAAPKTELVRFTVAKAAQG